MNIKHPIFLFFFVLLFATNTAAGDEPKTRQTLSNVNLEITTHLGDQQIFIDQDLVSFFISLDHDAYLYIFYQNANDEIYQLTPGLAQKNHFFESGFYIPYPSTSSSFHFHVQEPYGKETIWAYASDQPNIKFDTYINNHSIKQIKQSINNIERKLLSSSIKLYDRASTIIHTQKHR